MRKALAARRILASLAAVGVGACAAVLGIEERSLDEQDASTLPDGAGDAPLDVGRVEGESAAPEIPDAADAGVTICEPASCADAGGSCGDGGEGPCVIQCATGQCKAQDVTCPAGQDCVLACAAGACDKVRCVGGRSCTVDCSADNSCHNGVRCQSSRCELLCSGVQACGGGGGAEPVVCEASICVVNCAGAGSCTAGVSANATASCAISCTGSPSCDDGPPERVSCGASPSASIVCGPSTAACTAKPTCFGPAATCSIQCNGAGACQNGVCCEAGTCLFDAALSNQCP